MGRPAQQQDGGGPTPLHPPPPHPPRQQRRRHRLPAAAAAAWATAVCSIAMMAARAAPLAAAAEEASEAAEQLVPLKKEDRPRALIACKHAIWKKWSGGLEEIGSLVNATVEASRRAPNEEPALNYSQATRVLAERQLASCSREITAADLEVDKSGSLSDAAVDRLLGGPAADNTGLSTEEKELFDKAFRGEIANTDAPSIMGVQVHKVPVWLQVLYMVGVIAAVSCLVMFIVQRLTARDKEKQEKQQQKKKG